MDTMEGARFLFTRGKKKKGKKERKKDKKRRKKKRESMNKRLAGE